MQQTLNQPNAMRSKSMGIALLLATWFGPFGLLYSSITGGVIMITSLLAPFALIFISLFWLKDIVEEIIFVGFEWFRFFGIDSFRFNSIAPSSLEAYFFTSSIIMLAIFLQYLLLVWIISLIWAPIATFYYNQNLRTRQSAAEHAHETAT